MSNNLPKGFHKISDSSSPVVDVTSLDLSLLTGERGDGILVKEPFLRLNLHLCILFPGCIYPESL